MKRNIQRFALGLAAGCSVAAFALAFGTTRAMAYDAAPYSNATGYWYHSNWYNALPNVSATLDEIDGYWIDGVWHAPEDLPTSVAGTRGYWYRGEWNQVDDSERGGNYSADPFTGMPISIALNEKPGITGYKVGDSWYGALPQSTTTLSSIGSFWYNGKEYQRQGGSFGGAVN